MKKLQILISLWLTVAAQAANPNLRVHADRLEGITNRGDEIAFTIPKGIVQMVVKSENKLSWQPFTIKDCKVTVTRWIPGHLPEEQKAGWAKLWDDSCAGLTDYVGGAVQFSLSNHRVVMDMSRITQIDSRIIIFPDPQSSMPQH